MRRLLYLSATYFVVSTITFCIMLTTNAGADTTTTTLSPAELVLNNGNATTPAIMAMIVGLLVLPVVGVALRHTFNAVRNR